jgi:hypothetical protein
MITRTLKLAFGFSLSLLCVAFAYVWGLSAFSLPLDMPLNYHDTYLRGAAMAALVTIVGAAIFFRFAPRVFNLFAYEKDAKRRNHLSIILTLLPIFALFGTSVWMFIRSNNAASEHDERMRKRLEPMVEELRNQIRQNQ